MLGTQEASKQLESEGINVSPDQVARLARLGIFPGAEKKGTRWQIPPEDIAKYAQQRKRRMRRTRWLTTGSIVTLVTILTLISTTKDGLDLISTYILPERGATIVSEPIDLSTHVQCDTPIIHGFGEVWFRHPEIGHSLRCPPSSDDIEKATQSTFQIFPNGTMLWFDDVGQLTNIVYVLFDDDKTYQRFTGLGSANPPTAEEIPVGYHAIGEKFSGVYWRGTGVQVKERLGYATSKQIDSPSTYQQFQNGRMFWIGSMDRIFVIYDPEDDFGGVKRWEGYWDTYDVFISPEHREND